MLFISSKFGRLRGIPSHLEEAIAELENSLASPEGGERAGASPLAMILHGMDTATDSNLANQLRLFTQRYVYTCRQQLAALYKSSATHNRKSMDISAKWLL